MLLTFSFSRIYPPHSRSPLTSEELEVTIPLRDNFYISCHFRKDMAHCARLFSPRG